MFNLKNTFLAIRHSAVNLKENKTHSFEINEFLMVHRDKLKLK